MQFISKKHKKIFFLKKVKKVMRIEKSIVTLYCES